MKEKDRAVILSMVDRLSHMAKEVTSMPESSSVDMSKSLREMSTSLNDLNTLLKKLGASLRTLAASLRDDGVENSSEKARTEAPQFEGLIPICMYCKNIRDDKDHWETIEKYLECRTLAKFSHGICPDRFVKHVEKSE